MSNYDAPSRSEAENEARQDAFDEAMEQAYQRGRKEALEEAADIAHASDCYCERDIRKLMDSK